MGNEWDIQPLESTEAYKAFTTYIGMPNRNGQDVAKALGLSYTAIKEWRRLHAWRERARAYDMQISSKLLQLQETLIINNQETVIMDSLNDYNLLITKWRETLENKVTITASDLSIMISSRKRIDDLGRRAVRLPNVYSDNDITPPSTPPTRRLNWNNPIAELQQSNDGDSSSEEE